MNKSTTTAKLVPSEKGRGLLGLGVASAQGDNKLVLPSFLENDKEKGKYRPGFSQFKCVVQHLLNSFSKKKNVGIPAYSCIPNTVETHCLGCEPEA